MPHPINFIYTPINSLYPAPLAHFLLRVYTKNLGLVDFLYSVILFNSMTYAISYGLCKVSRQRALLCNPLILLILFNIPLNGSVGIFYICYPGTFIPYPCNPLILLGFSDLARGVLYVGQQYPLFNSLRLPGLCHSYGLAYAWAIWQG